MAVTCGAIGRAAGASQPRTTTSAIEPPAVSAIRPRCRRNLSPGHSCPVASVRCDRRPTLPGATCRRSSGIPPPRRRPGPGQAREHGPSRQGHPRHGPSRQGHPRYGPSRQGHPRHGPSRQGHPRHGAIPAGSYSPGTATLAAREDTMTRLGGMYGPDATFLGVPRADLAEPESWAGTDIMIIGAPFDGGTSHRPGARFGPQAIRFTDYLPHDGSRPHLALRVDPLADLRVADAGDIEMPSGDTELSVRRLEEAVQRAAQGGAIPVILGGDHTIALPDATGVARHVGWGRLSMIHFDAHADTGDTQFGSLIGHGTPMRRLIESGAVRGDRFLQIGLRGYWPEPQTLDWMARQRMRSYEMTEITFRGLD